MLLSGSSNVNSPWLRILILFLSIARSAMALPIAAGWPPPGVQK
jgi:hypothetical protein